jgi:hypothetical protein
LRRRTIGEPASSSTSAISAGFRKAYLAAGHIRPQVHLALSSSAPRGYGATMTNHTPDAALLTKAETLTEALPICSATPVRRSS